MREMIEYIARCVVENPDKVEVTEEQDGETLVLRLKVAEEDMGRVIGRQGRIAQAMRAILSVAAIRQGTRATLEIG